MFLCEEDKPLLARVAEGLRLLEDDALGGSGSRGSGRGPLSKNLKLTWRAKDYYAKGESETALLDNAGLSAFQQLVAAEDFAGKLA